jgi:hypothetical protein
MGSHSVHTLWMLHVRILSTSRGTRRCPGWSMAKPDSIFVYYITKSGDGINCGNVSEWNMRHVTYEMVHNLTRKHTCKKKKAASWMNTMSSLTMNRKTKTCNEIGMLLSVWNVTEVFCFPFRSRNVNVCRVSDFWACSIYLPMWEAWITVLSCRSQNISQKGRNRWEGRRGYINTGSADTHTHTWLSGLAALCCHPVSETSRWNDGKGWEGESMCRPQTGNGRRTDEG